MIRKYKRPISFKEIGRCLFGSPARTRTTDPVVNSHLLYRLSYWGMVQQIETLRDSRTLCQGLLRTCHPSAKAILQHSFCVQVPRHRAGKIAHQLLQIVVDNGLQLG